MSRAERAEEGEKRSTLKSRNGNGSIRLWQLAIQCGGRLKRHPTASYGRFVNLWFCTFYPMFILIVRDKFLHLFLLPFLFERCEDRFFLGPPQLMLPLRFLSSNIAYLFAPFLGDFNTTMLTSRRSDNHRRRLDNIDGAMSIRGGSNDGVRKINDEGSINTSNINCSTHENSSGSGDASDSAKMNAGRTVDEDASDRASVLALLKLAKLFCPETLLYEYLSAIAASQEATVSTCLNFVTVCIILPHTRLYNLASELFCRFYRQALLRPSHHDFRRGRYSILLYF